MIQRHSGYERIKADLYETPEWVTRIIIPYIPPDFCATPGKQIDKDLYADRAAILEPACGSGKMAKELRRHGFKVVASDIDRGYDFLSMKHTQADAIVTNPPYSLAQPFVEHALELVPFVAMLLPSEWDTAKGRRHLFGAESHFRYKIVITKRIRWIKNSIGQPSANHCWLIWDGRSDWKAELRYWYE